MSKFSFSLPFVLMTLSLGCSTDDDAASTASGGQTNTGGSSTGGSSTGGSSGAGSGGDTGQSGSAGSSATGGGGQSGAGGLSGTSGVGGTAGEAGNGGAGECSPSSSDSECARCMLENCCAEWQACEGDTECNACSTCLEADGSDLAMCLGMSQCPDITDEPEAAAMITCGCGAELGSDCTGPCAEPCGLSPD
jgi:hypothetical protein